MFAAAERLRDEPGRYFPALGRAKDALAAWRAKYPAAAEAEDTRREAARKADAERREREYRDGFIGRGLD